MVKTIVLKILVPILFIVTIGNTLYLDWLTFFSEKKESDESIDSIIPTESPTLVPQNIVEEAGKTACLPVCLQAIKDATASINLQPVKETARVQTPTASVKEVFIPLGTGSITSTSWTDMSGLETYIDKTKYGKIIEANFEATLRIPTATGKVSARLYNVSDKHPVWFSEVEAQGGSGTLLRSEKIVLDEGNKLYRVQMMSTIAQAILDNARIRIVYQ